MQSYSTKESLTLFLLEHVASGECIHTQSSQPLTTPPSSNFPVGCLSTVINFDNTTPNLHPDHTDLQISILQRVISHIHRRPLQSLLKAHSIAFDPDCSAYTK